MDHWALLIYYYLSLPLLHTIKFFFIIINILILQILLWLSYMCLWSSHWLPWLLLWLGPGKRWRVHNNCRLRQCRMESIFFNTNLLCNCFPVQPCQVEKQIWVLQECTNKQPYPQTWGKYRVLTAWGTVTVHVDTVVDLSLEIKICS